jgi:hypothetical protein
MGRHQVASFYSDSCDPPARRTRRAWIAAALLAFALPPASARAGGLTMSLADVTGPTAGAGTIEVLLADTDSPASQPYDVASFSFEVAVSPASGVQFMGATTATTDAPYIFEGTGEASIDLPNTDVTGSDTEFTYPSIAVGPGVTFGLGLISYEVIPGAPAGDVPISFIPFGTSLSDALGGPITFGTDDQDGVIHIAGNAVPEPSGLRIAFGAVVIILFACVVRAVARRVAIST